jgi:hypothetical protein
MLRLPYTEDGGTGFLCTINTCIPKYTASFFYSEDKATAASETLAFFCQLQDVTSTQNMAASFSESSAVPVHTMSYPTIGQHSTLL